MFVRKNSAKIGAAAGVAGLAASAVALAVLAPIGATAATGLNTTLNQGAAPTAKPVDNSTAGTGTIVFAGSDTIQYVVADLADAWNKQADAAKTVNGKKYDILSYNALKDDGGTVTPIGSSWVGIDGTTNSNIVTPNGSGGGLNLLGSSDANGGSVISYARSSSAPDKSNTLLNKKTSDGTGYPFALDTVVLAVSAKNTAAPQTLTDAQVLSIYNGTDTDWSQAGGTSAPLHPLQPKSGSGTAKFFTSAVGKISTANGLGTVTDDGNGIKGISDSYTPAGTTTAVPVPEHSGAPLINDADAVVPISLGRAILWNQTHDANSQIRVIGGFKEQRALWIFARTDAAGDAARDQHNVNPDVYAGGKVTNALLGSQGFFCTPAAQAIVAADGFYPLSGKYCGASRSDTGDIVPASGTNSEDSIAPADMFVANPLLDITTTGPTQSASPTPTSSASPSPSTSTTPVVKAPTAAEKKLASDQAKLKKLKKQYKKAHGHKKTVLKKKITKLNKAIKKDKKLVAAGK